MANIALLPGGFKPPHAGHYAVAKFLSQKSGAEVLVRVGAKERDNVTQNMSIKIWGVYGIKAEPASSDSPIADVFKYVEEKATQEDTIYVGTGEKDFPRFKVLTDPSFKPENYKKYNPKGVKVIEIPIPPQAGGVSGTKMREFIKNDQKDLFQKFLPEHLSDEQKEQAWGIVTGLNESGADTSWEDEDGNKITLEDILDLTKNIPIKNYPTEKLAKVVLNWDDNPEEVDRISQVEVSKQYPILIMVDEGGKIQWILDGNHRAQKALRAKSETIPAKLIKPSNLDAKAKKIFNLEEDLYDPNDHVLDYMKSSEWKAGMPDGPKPDKTSPVIKYQRGGMYNAASGQGGAGTMYETDEKGKILHVYDFDDTIAQVKANIKVFITSPSGDYNKEILIPAANFPEESKELEARLGSLKIKYDFSEFEKQIGDAIVNSKVLNKLKDSLSRPDVKTTILTARSIGHPVTRYLKSIGLDAYVVPLGLQVDGKVTGQDKADWIEKHINKGYKTVYFIDDSEENRTAVSGLKDKYPDVNLTVEDPAAVNEMMGMMNKQEKAKHAKNMKRLSKDMSNMKGNNYGGGGHKVPDYVKGTLTRKLYEKTETSVFSKDWWKEQLTEVLTETKANTHLTHLEELILTQGQDGFNQAKAFLYELIKNLKGESNNIKNVSVKWDGAPAIWAGINPDNAKFFVGTKSIFNKEPKINYTSQDIDTNHGHAAGLAKKLKLALQYLPAVGINGILQGDFMFDSDDVGTSDIEGVTHYTFKPNTIRYAVEANSEIGKKILSAKIGIIWHTTYKDLSSESGASFGADVSGLSETPNVWFDNAYFKDDTGILLSDQEEKFILEKINEADSVKVDYTDLPLKALNTYLNSEIRQGEFVSDPTKSFENFKNWYQLAVNKSIEKVKRPESKESKRKAGEDKIREFESQKENIINIFRVSKILSEAKAIFIAKYDKAVATKHFIDNGDGTLSVTKAEGFVAVDHTENGIKLVDRLEFSRNNFNAGKPGAKK
jgi:hypothetical protein